MKKLKLISFLGIFAFSLFFLSSCEDENELFKQVAQVHIEKKFPIEDALYRFPHLGKDIFAEFKNNVFTMSYGDSITSQGSLVDVYKYAYGERYKVITETIRGEKKYYTIFIQKIKEKTIELNCKNYDTLEAAIKDVFPSTTEKFNHKTYEGWVKFKKSSEAERVAPPKEDDKSDSKNKLIFGLSGTYDSQDGRVDEVYGQKSYVVYHFKIIDSETIRYTFDMKGYSDPSIKMKKVYEDKKTGQIVAKIIKGEGYYEGSPGYYITFYIKDIKEDHESFRYCIATKNGGHSIATSVVDQALTKDLEEAKAIKAPADDQTWDGNMFAYAHLWIKASRQKK